MTAMFNTGNAVPSAAPQDRSDNTQVLDLAINSDADTYRDRLNRLRRTLSWMERAATGIPAVQAALDAVAARDQVMLSAGMYPDAATGLAAAAEGGYFSVVGPDPKDFVILYRKLSGAAVEQKRWPTKASLDDVLKLISPNGNTEYHLSLVDDEGGIIFTVSNTSIEAPSVALRQEEGVTALMDNEYGVTLYHDSEKTLLGPLELSYTELPGAYVVNEFDEVLKDLTRPEVTPPVDRLLPLEGDILFECSKIPTSEEFEVALYPKSMLTYRERFDEVEASVSGVLADATTGDVLPISAARMGSSMVLSLRDRIAYDARRMMTVNLVDVPTQSPAIPLNVMLIGDSIGNRQGGFFLDKYLRLMGGIPTFVGTLNGSAIASDSNNATGPLGEAREGWETGDYTYQVTDRVSIVAPGGESAYLSSSKTVKAPINPFLRVATGADNSELVRNGMIFDFAYYLTRYSLATPDVIGITLGTNDARDRTAEEIRAVVKANLKIMITQIRAAAPLAKVIISIPGTSFSSRNELWTTDYSEVIKAFREVKADLADPLVSIAPLWAMCNHETGYSFSSTIKGADGFSNVAFSDPTHPIGSNRETLYKSFAPFFMAAKLNLI